jgi:ABC-type transport system substrate-binding protein
MLTVNDPNRRMVLEKNPNFRGEPFPAPADPDAASDYPVGQTMPFIDRVVFSLEKEQIPYWNKFLQGYYDASGISSDSFGEAIRVDRNGEPHLTQTMAQRGVTLKTTVSPAIYYLGFNMQDDVVGGDDERARLLRRAISIALDYESYIAIFRNGRGIAAQGPIPPGIFGTQDGEQGINPYVYDWDNGRARRKSVEHARELLARAGYPGGVNEQTGEPLLLNLDTPATGPEFKAQLDWMRKQFSKLNIQLVVRATAYNRFQEKLASGAVQLFQSGWLADYPDPENFLFLLYGPNGSVDHNGENVANYDNERFDQLFRQMRIMDNGPQRRALIRQMVDIVQRDAPWIWGFYPRTYILHQAWLNNGNPNAMANNTLKYLQIEPQQRLAKQSAWNDPVIWPLPALAGILLAGLLPGFLVYRRRERQAPVVKS